MGLAKFRILTNGLGIIRAIEFYDKDYFASHPEIERYKKTDAPDEDKSVGDARLLLPLLKDFFKKHPLINPVTFLGDAAFDSLAGITQLITVVVADRIHKPEYLRSLKRLVA